LFKVDLDPDIQEFVFNWLKNNLMISGLKLSSSDDPEFAALEDNLILEVGGRFFINSVPELAKLAPS
jgi:hypothetical protein